eukprot:tig00001366_g8380.t1
MASGVVCDGDEAIDGTNDLGDLASELFADLHEEERERLVVEPVPAGVELPRRCVVGVCCMDKKSRSGPMHQILSRLEKTGELEVVIFGNQCILERPIEEWPLCDCLIAFDSDGFPLEKAIAYQHLRRPYSVNDLPSQRLLLDRREVYRILSHCNLLQPKHVFASRDGWRGEPSPVMDEGDDWIEINGKRIEKPFVEKPADADDHNVCIYYPMRDGGGCRQLFRKTQNRSSQFFPDRHRVRREGSYVYEEFVRVVDGQDIKIYTVGPSYAHAERRKAPVIDGLVLRNAHDKEIRFPVLLTPAEKAAVQQICVRFRQTVCGLDLLRVEGGGLHICDVNGWSFVKGSPQYYDNCARILRDYALRAFLKRHAAAGPS